MSTRWGLRFGEAGGGVGKTAKGEALSARPGSWSRAEATTVRLKTWEIQLVIVLCNFETVGLARECRQDLALFKNRHRKDLQQCVERRLQPEPFAHDRNQHIDRNGVSCRCS